MAQDQLNILDLNDDCLSLILKYVNYIDLNDAENPEYNYFNVKDVVSFSQTCKRFREVLRDWTNILYPEFMIRNSSTLQWQMKLFFATSDVIRKMYINIGGVMQSNAFPIQKICEHLSCMNDLEYLAISKGSITERFTKISENPSGDTVEQLFDALRSLPNLKSLSVKSRSGSYNADKLVELKHLESLSIDAKMSSENLVKLCKGNPGVRVLWLREVLGEISEIVPHCQNLTEIAFPMLRSHTSYVELAKLPKLRKLIITSTNSNSPCAKLIELLSELSTQGTKLESLVLLSSLNQEETEKLADLKSLKELRCDFDDASNIDILTNLSDLEGLYIMLGRGGDGQKECLNVLRSCKKLQRLHINANLSIEFITKALEVLRKVRNTKSQKPLELYSTGIMHLCKEEEEEKLMDNDYCIVTDRSPYLRALPWKLPQTTFRQRSEFT